MLCSFALPLQGVNNGNKQIIKNGPAKVLFGKCKPSEPKFRPLELSDFRGERVFGIDSFGGTAGPLAVQTSSTIDGQVTLDGSGDGTVNFGTGISYVGNPGVFTTLDINGFCNLILTFELHDTGTTPTSLIKNVSACI